VLSNNNVPIVRHGTSVLEGGGISIKLLHWVWVHIPSLCVEEGCWKEEDFLLYWDYFWLHFKFTCSHFPTL